MLATSSINLTGEETFEEAFAQIPERDTKIRYLKTDDGEDVGVYQISTDGERWSSPRLCPKKDGIYVPIDVNSKNKLKNSSLFYDTFTKPVYAGSNDTLSWFVGDIDSCEITNEKYDVQGLIISSIFDPRPKYYISFKRLVCENQFGSLGTSSSSMYIDMNKFLMAAPTMDAKEKLQSLISDEVEKRILTTQEVNNKLLAIHMTDSRVEQMFKKLTVDTVAKDSERYQEQEMMLQRYLDVYDCDDNQNFKGTFFGFVNSCTNINSRVKESPIDVIKPVISPAIIKQPCNLDYLCRDVLVNAA